MKRIFVCILALTLICGCSRKNREDGGSTSERLPETGGLSEDASSADPDVSEDDTFPYPVDPSGEIIITEGEDGSVYINGVPTPPEKVPQVVEEIKSRASEAAADSDKEHGNSSPSGGSQTGQSQSGQANSGGSAGANTSPKIPEKTDMVADPEDPDRTDEPIPVLPGEPEYSMFTDDPNFQITTEYQWPEGTIYLDEDDYIYAKYYDTGNTKLDIKNVEVYSNEAPGKEGIGSFKSGNTLLVNIWCNTSAALDSEFYILTSRHDHKSSYTSDEYIYKANLFSAINAGDGLLVLEIKLPRIAVPADYDFRFCCGGEEGYITFYLSQG